MKPWLLRFYLGKSVAAPTLIIHALASLKYFWHLDCEIPYWVMNSLTELLINSLKCVPDFKISP